MYRQLFSNFVTEYKIDNPHIISNKEILSNKIDLTQFLKLLLPTFLLEYFSSFFTLLYFPICDLGYLNPKFSLNFKIEDPIKK